jgi:hypothetical protein
MIELAGPRTNLVLHPARWMKRCAKKKPSSRTPHRKNPTTVGEKGNDVHQPDDGEL